MPAFKRGSSPPSTWRRACSCAIAEWHATYYVDPIDPTWPADKVESYLRGQNDYEVQLVAAHEAYPGHHTQYFYSKRNLNPLRAVLWNAPDGRRLGRLRRGADGQARLGRRQERSLPRSTTCVGR